MELAVLEPIAPDAVLLPVTREDIERVEAQMLDGQQIDIPLTERFAPGVYLREVVMPEGVLVIGHEHKTSHFNVVLTGSALVMMNGECHRIQAPFTFVSQPFVRKVLFIEETMVWQTVHPTDETDAQKLRELLIVESPSFQNRQKNLADVEKLKQIATIQPEPAPAV